MSRIKLIHVEDPNNINLLKVLKEKNDKKNDKSKNENCNNNSSVDTQIKQIEEGMKRMMGQETMELDA